MLHTRLLAAGFDRGSARALGAPPLLADAALLSLLAVAVLVAVPALGNLLVVAVLIAPAAAARLRCRRMAPMMATATALALLGGLAGLYASYHLHTAAGASIAVSLILGYLVVAAGAGRATRRAGGARPVSLGADGGVDGGA
jgi:ABC-type Mn2+/Zn2+ transport system permease subunit